MPLTSGERLGPYEIVAPLGAGGMGEVYKARDTRLDRIVAVKILPPALAADAVFRERFDREARTISSLDHPHICALHDVGEQAGLAYIVMQFVEGDTLADRLRRGAMSYAEAGVIGAQVASALEAAHERGIVHRDLKPGNIVVSRDGVATVLDFGLAKDVTAPGAAALSMSPTMIGGPTQPGVILGTAAYMAPEQARGLAVDKRADIWAFGCVLYEMLAGRPAFRGDTVTDIVAAVVTHEPDWSALPLATPVRVRDLLRRCLVKDPKRRLRDVGDARIELEERDVAAVPPVPAPRPRTRERLGWMLAGLFAGATLALGLVTLLRIGRAAPSTPIVRLEMTTPPTADPGSFALSPDGRTLVFVATTDTGTQLWLRQLAQPAPQRIAGTEGATQPFWSPDNRSIAFFADGKLKRIDRDGSAMRVLAEAPFPRGGTWSLEGVILFSPNSPGGLVRVPADGGPTTVVTQGETVSHRWPQFLDRRRFIYYAALSGSDTNGVYLASLDGGEPKRIIDAEAAPSFAPPNHLLLVHQGVLDRLAFDVAGGTVSGSPETIATGVGIDTNLRRAVMSVSETGVLAHRGNITAHRQLVWVDRTGASRRSVGPPDEFAPSSPSLSSDGRRVAESRFVQGNVDIWLVDVARGVPTRFTFDPTVELSPVWSPDGRRIVFESSRAGVSALMAKSVNGADEGQPLLTTADRKLPTDWSADGRMLLYQAHDAVTGADIWALSLDGDRKPFPIVQTRFAETSAQFSPDQRWIAYASDASGRNEVYVRPFRGSAEAVQVSADGGSQPRWRRDGKELFYVGVDGRLTAVAIAIGQDGQTIDAGVPVPLFPARLATVSNVYLGQTQYAVAFDGRFLMNVSTDDAAVPPIAITLDWQAALKR